MLFEKIRSVICDYYECEENEVTPETSFEELGADSLDMIDLVMTIEDDFQLEVTDETLEGFRTVKDVVAFLEENL